MQLVMSLNVIVATASVIRIHDSGSAKRGRASVMHLFCWPSGVYALAALLAGGPRR